MGTTAVSHCVQTFVISGDDDDEDDSNCNKSSIETSVISNTTNVASQNKMTTTNTELDIDSADVNVLDTNELISQFGSYFSINQSSENTPSIQSVSSSSKTHYTVSSEKSFSKCSSALKSPETPLSPRSPRSPSIHRRSSTFQNDNEFKIFRGKYQVPCCKAIKRIIKILKWQSLTVENDILIQKVMDSQYHKYLLDDYQHILNNHLYELKAIRDEANKQIGACNAAECHVYERYMELLSKDLSHCDDATFCVDLIGLIHCYIIHCKI